MKRGAVWEGALSALWFAHSWKWFILLLALLPGQVAEIVPEGEKNSAWGFIFTAGAVWAIFGPALFGRLSDKLGRRKPFLAIGCCLTVVALAFLSQAGALWMLAVGYLFLQVSDDVVQGANASLVPQLVAKERRGRASSILSGLNLFAQIAAALSALAIGTQGRFGLSVTELIYVQLALVQLLMLGVVLWAMRKMKEPFPVAVQSEPRAFFAAWRDPDFAWTWAMRFAVAIGYYLIQPFLLNYLKDVIADRDGDTYRLSFFGMTLEGADTGIYVVGLTISLTGALAAIWAARNTDRLGRKKLIVASGWIMGVLMVPFAFVGEFTYVWLIAGVFGMGYGLYMSASWAMATDVMPDQDALGQDMGLWQSSETLSQLSPAVTGLAIDALNRAYAPNGYRAAILVAAAIIFVGCQFARRVQGSR